MYKISAILGIHPEDANVSNEHESSSLKPIPRRLLVPNPTINSKTQSPEYCSPFGVSSDKRTQTHHLRPGYEPTDQPTVRSDTNPMESQQMVMDNVYKEHHSPIGLDRNAMQSQQTIMGKTYEEQQQQQHFENLKVQRLGPCERSQQQIGQQENNTLFVRQKSFKQAYTSLQGAYNSLMPEAPEKSEQEIEPSYKSSPDLENQVDSARSLLSKLRELSSSSTDFVIIRSNPKTTQREISSVDGKSKPTDIQLVPHERSYLHLEPDLCKLMDSLSVPQRENIQVQRNMTSSNGTACGDGCVRYQLCKCQKCPFTDNSQLYFSTHSCSRFHLKCGESTCFVNKESEFGKNTHEELRDLDPKPTRNIEAINVSKENAPLMGKSFKCRRCDYNAKSKTDFWRHVRSHIKIEKLLTCPKCPFVTEHRHHLEYHWRTHTGSKPFKCSECQYSSASKSMLSTHMKTHSDVYQFRCADCKFATKYCHSLKLHLRRLGHRPAVVLNPDGSPNPSVIVDVYGKKRSRKLKKNELGMTVLPSHHQTNDDNESEDEQVPRVVSSAAVVPSVGGHITNQDDRDNQREIFHRSMPPLIPLNEHDTPDKVAFDIA